ncbi:hypothetical protein IRT45_21445 [Nocardia sp. BSTN01]|uniref:hypothetical protein n=1 Tax=Nocardia sp. BSTN01 TaxID=2783665 RepID=UPI00188EDC7E|nr:hypothetical protein [Nocardia sp. BSTN01]MBF4999713.1 hypothetical protein [Nocardia sp. BSTN01]
MNRRARLLVAIASTLPLGLGVVICCLLVAAGTAPKGVLSALAIAVVVQGVLTYIRLRRTTPLTRRGRASAENTNP